MNRFKNYFILIMVLIVYCVTCLVGCGQTSSVESTSDQDIYYNVTFVQEGEEDIVKEVIEGGTLTDIPTPVAVDGYNVYWDRTDFTNITQDITVTAVMEKIAVYYTVTFVQEGQENIEKQVAEGGTLTDIPTPVAVEGYNVSWDRTDFSNITQDITVTAVMEKIAVYYTVTFVQEGQTNIEKQVAEGGTLTDIPTPVAVDGYNVYWDRTDFTNITQDVTVTAILELIEMPAPADYVDFIVNVESGREIRILQLTDIQTLDESQKRYTDRVTATTSPNLLQRYERYIGQVIQLYKPDLIIMTGDNVYGEFDDSGYQLKELIRIMDSFKTPWAPVFGNHDNESHMGVDWQCQQYENSKYCLFKQRDLTGNGNYTVGIVQNGDLKRVFYMLDSNGCSSMSAASYANGHSKREVGFGKDQIQWYTESITTLKETFPTVKVSMAFHIQLAVFEDAFKKYGYDATTIKNNPINLDTLAEAQAAGDFGYIGRALKNPWDTNYSVWNGIKALGVDSIFVGHEHCNSASVVYEGVRLSYGQKSSTFDRYLSINNGTYNESRTGDPVMGGTYFNLSSDGSITDAGLYLYDKDKEYQETEKATANTPPLSIEERVAECQEYELAELDEYQAVLGGGKNIFLSIDDEAYALAFAMNPITFEGSFVVSGCIANGTATGGINVTFTKNQISIGKAKIDFAFSGTTYNVKIGFVNLYEGNTTFVFVMIDEELLIWELVETKDRTPGNINMQSDTAGDEFVLSLTTDPMDKIKNEWATGNSAVTATFNYDLENSDYSAWAINQTYSNAMVKNNATLQAKGFWTEESYVGLKPLVYSTTAVGSAANNSKIALGYYNNDDFKIACTLMHSYGINMYNGRADYLALQWKFTDVATGNYFSVSANGYNSDKTSLNLYYNEGITTSNRSKGKVSDSIGVCFTGKGDGVKLVNLWFDASEKTLYFGNDLGQSVNVGEFLAVTNFPGFEAYTVELSFRGFNWNTNYQPGDKNGNLAVYYLNGVKTYTMPSATPEWTTGNSDVSATFNYDFANSDYKTWPITSTDSKAIAENNEAFAEKGFWTEEAYNGLKPLVYSTTAVGSAANNATIALGNYDDDFKIACTPMQSFARGASGWTTVDYMALQWKFTDIATGNYFSVLVSTWNTTDGRLNILYNKTISNGDGTWEGLVSKNIGVNFMGKNGNNLLNLWFDVSEKTLHFGNDLSQSINVEEFLATTNFPEFEAYTVELSFRGFNWHANQPTDKTGNLAVYYLNGVKTYDMMPATKE